MLNINDIMKKHLCNFWMLFSYAAGTKMLYQTDCKKLAIIFLKRNDVSHEAIFHKAKRFAYLISALL